MFFTLLNVCLHRSLVTHHKSTAADARRRLLCVKLARLEWEQSEKAVAIDKLSRCVCVNF